MKRRKITFVLMAALLSVITFYSLGTAFEGGPRGHFGITRILEELKLSDAQKAEVATILKSNRNDMRGLADEMFQARKNLADQTTTVPINKDQIREAARRVGAIQEELAVSRAKVASLIHDVLTPEQQKAFQEIKAELQDRVGGHFKNRLSMLDRWIDANSSLN